MGMRQASVEKMVERDLRYSACTHHFAHGYDRMAGKI